MNIMNDGGVYMKKREKKEKKNLKNISVKKRLAKSFKSVVIIASIAGILGAGLTIGLSFRYDQVLHNNGFIQGDLGEYSTYLNKGAADVRDIILLTDEALIAETKADLAKVDEKVDFYLHEFETKLENQEERALLADIKAEYPLYIEARKEVIALGEQNKGDEALELFVTKANPHLKKIIEDDELKTILSNFYLFKNNTGNGIEYIYTSKDETFSVIRCELNDREKFYILSQYGYLNRCKLVNP